MWVIDFLTSIAIPTAHAQLSDVANFVGNGLVPFFTGDATGEGGAGAYAYTGIAGFLLRQAKTIVWILTVLLLVRAGIKLIYGQSDDKFEEAKRSVANGLMAVVLVFLTTSLVDAFIRLGGSWAPESGTAIFTTELLGIVRWVEVLVAVLAIGMIIAAVFSSMFAIGGGEGLDRIKRAIFGAAAGILILGIDVAFRATFGLAYNTVPGTPSPFPIISRALVVIGYLLGFMALIAVCIVIYAGIMIVLSLGDEDKFKNMRSLIFRALLGLFVILVSFVIVGFVIQAFSG